MAVAVAAAAAAAGHPPPDASEAPRRSPTTRQRRGGRWHRRPSAPAAAGFFARRRPPPRAAATRGRGARQPPGGGRPGPRLPVGGGHMGGVGWGEADGIGTYMWVFSQSVKRRPRAHLEEGPEAAAVPVGGGVGFLEQVASASGRLAQVALGVVTVMWVCMWREGGCYLYMYCTWYRLVLSRVGFTCPARCRRRRRRTRGRSRRREGRCRPCSPCQPGWGSEGRRTNKESATTETGHALSYSLSPSVDASLPRVTQTSNLGTRTHPVLLQVQHDVEGPQRARAQNDEIGLPKTTS